MLQSELMKPCQRQLITSDGGGTLEDVNPLVVALIYKKEITRYAKNDNPVNVSLHCCPTVCMLAD